MKNKYVFIQTFGCQMNKSDSEKMYGILETIGYFPTQDIEKADLIILNSCSVRENAVNRLLGNLGSLKSLKEKKNNLIIGVSGCVPQHEKENLLKKVPFLDLVFGTQTYHLLPEILRQFEKDQKPIVKIINQQDEIPENLPIKRAGKYHAWITIINGCSNYCTYCIVPYVRGKEMSRKPEYIIKEVKELVSDGVQEIILLGQNVNVYGWDLIPKTDLTSLLYKLHEIDSLKRIRFLTSHPKDIKDDLIKVVADLPKVCEFFHLPMQSGDDEILKKMNRGYDKKYYANLIEKIRTYIPDAAITSDFIVGFPGESEKNFENTVKAIYEFQFDQCNTASYSKRPGTKAATLKEQVSKEEKLRRLNYLNEVVKEVAKSQNKKLIGKTQQVLVEEYDPKRDNLKGRSRTNKIVHFKGNKELIGKIINVNITDASASSLKGEIQLC